VWARWLTSYPDLSLLDLDIGVGHSEARAFKHVTRLTSLLFTGEERRLYRALSLLMEQRFEEVSALLAPVTELGSLLPDLHLLAGALELHYGRLEAASAHFERCYGRTPEPGNAIRRLCPNLRLLLRISPCGLVPLYPSAFAVSACYAAALLAREQAGDALQIVDEMRAAWGLYDEAKLLAGRAYLLRGEAEKALAALRTEEDTQHDALELSRGVFLAYAHYLREEYRNAARVLVPMLKTIKQANPHLLARARLLLAECFERSGLLLNALRESAQVVPGDVPGDVAREMLAREERWVVELGTLSNFEVEQLAKADTYQAYLPDAPRQVAKMGLLETSRDPLKKLRPKAASWLKQQDELRQIERVKASVARGETVMLANTVPLSAEGREIKTAITLAEQWWPSRRQALQQAAASARERLALTDPAATGHLRFDWQGQREEPGQMLAGEKRAAFLSVAALAVVLLWLGLWLLRSCVY
jgi:hypothetical protein